MLSEYIDFKNLFIAIVFLLSFSWALAQLSPVDSYSDMHRGCVASAYQAEMRGFDLEKNLKACEQYEN